MKISLYSLFFILLVIVSCSKPQDPAPSSSSILKGSFKAREVKEGSQTVYKETETANVIPGYAKFRLRLSTPDMGVFKAQLIEYSGETFDGKWTYDEKSQTLSLTNLSPKPAAGDLIYAVERVESGLVVLRSKTANPKTGQTINEYTLIPE
ncbi:hypothetical protein GCM10028807_28470 [Spirosoma daeguense]